MQPVLNRRTFGKAMAGVAAGMVAGGPAFAAVSGSQNRLHAAGHTAKLISGRDLETPVWGYNQVTPGPVLTVRQGEEFQARLINDLDHNTTIHWHGIRTPIAMDGVPGLSQPPVRPGKAFDYKFIAEDAGTFWYHPHVNSAEQVGRGLSGAVIVEAAADRTLDVDQDLVWMLDDWRLQDGGDLAPFGGNMHDYSHAGRLGNVPTVNGKAVKLYDFDRGTRLRLRLVNAANARVFGLHFADFPTWKIAVDGQPCPPEDMQSKMVVVPPGGRVDLIVDCHSGIESPIAVRDSYYSRQPYNLVGICLHGKDTGSRRTAPPALPANPIAVPDMTNIRRLSLELGGGAMGNMRSALYQGEETPLRELARMGMVWAFNGEVLPPMTLDDPGKPIFDLTLGESCLISLKNDTAFDHPIHLHGHTFFVVRRNGKVVPRPQAMDTVLLQPGDEADIALVADNPGDWAFHCHVLEHADAGMMGYVRVS